jgi:hypothetical protein
LQIVCERGLHVCTAGPLRIFRLATAI